MYFDLPFTFERQALLFATGTSDQSCTHRRQNRCWTLITGSSSANPEFIVESGGVLFSVTLITVNISGIVSREHEVH